MMSADYRELLTQALLKLEEKEREIAAVRATKPDPIAVVGLGCRFPGGANDPDSFWQMMHDGVDAISEVPPDRWDVDRYYSPAPDTPGKLITRDGGFVESPCAFDAQFFGIAPREAASLDPQQRLLLEVTWEALEDAGIAVDRLAETHTGVFIGICGQDYLHQLGTRGPESIDAYLATGNLHSVAAGRLSYQLGLQGPCLSVDTACSSSLVALHLACQSLRSRECNTAIVGGVNHILSPRFGINFSQAHMLAPDGRCKTFDASANGFVRSEGCGIVILRRLPDARAAEDTIRALVRGSAVNQDGRTSGLTVPNGRSQEALIRAALQDSNKEPGHIDYVEAHGTGTSLGDPIEVEALAGALGQGHSREKPLWIGSVKTNIGHLEGAAGVAGLIKAILALQHREIPPHLHLRQPTPHIDWGRIPLSIPTQGTPWPRRDHRRSAGVSSFGFCGTNAHAILEEAPDAPVVSPEATRSHHLLTLSAKSDLSLKRLAGRYAGYLADHLDLPFEQICATANRGRTHLDHRVGIIATDPADARAKLSGWMGKKTAPTVISGSITGSVPPGVVFLFTGQGAQYPGMGKELYHTQPVFRRTMDRCNELLRDRLERPLLEVIFDESEPSAVQSDLDQTVYTQPALYVFEAALADLWRSWGVEPAAVLGHSVGEYAAAYTAGVFSLEEGLNLIAERARLLHALPAGGAMVAIHAAEDRVRNAISTRRASVSVAAANGPRLTVASGPRPEVETVVAALANEGVRASWLRVSHAFHSRLVDPMMEAYGQVTAGIAFRTPQIDFVSSVSGKLSTVEVTTAAYWTHQVREPVRFQAAMQTLGEEGYEAFVEVGPQPTLLSMGRECAPEIVGIWLPSLRPRCPEWQQMLTGLAQLYAHGVSVDWQGVDGAYASQRASLPTYPWDRTRHWIEEAESNTSPASANALPTETLTHPLLGRRHRSAAARGDIEFESVLRADAPVYLADHRVFETPVVPAAAFLETFLAAGSAMGTTCPMELTDVLFSKILTLSASPSLMQCIVKPGESGGHALEVFSCTPDEDIVSETWVSHATGSVGAATGTADRTAVLVDHLRRACPDRLSVEDHYRGCRERGVQFGPAFRVLEQLWGGAGQALGRIALPEARTPCADESYHLHPTLLDGCFQVLVAVLPPDGDTTYLPHHVRRMTVWRKAGTRVWSYVRTRTDPRRDHPETLEVDIQILDETGSWIAEVEGLTLTRTSGDVLRSSGREAWKEWLYEVDWRHHPLPERIDPPTFLREIPAIERRLRRQIDARMSTDVITRQAEILCGLERAGFAYIVEALVTLGIDFTLGTRVEADPLAAQAGVVAHQQRLLSHLLSILGEAGVLQADGDGWTVVQVPDPPDASEWMQALDQQYPDADAERSLLRICGPRLADVLKGTCDPVQLMFPGGDTGPVTYLYDHAFDMQVLNELVQQAVQTALEQLPADRTIRILEIGAGTGATTAAIVPHLPTSRTDYRFTDVSALFTTEAQDRFHEFPFVRYHTLDIERDPASQGIGPHSVDLVLAANVLHATRHLGETVAHIQDMLAPGGLLILLEGTTPRRWVDLTFGLLEGWWRFKDPTLRPTYPLISGPRWKELLESTGFTPVEVVSPQERSDQLAFPQSIVLARNRGAPGDSARSSQKRWLVYADHQGTGSALADRLRAEGDACTLVYTGTEFVREDCFAYRMRPNDDSDTGMLLDAMMTPDADPLYGVVHLWSLDAPAAETMTAPDLGMAQETGCGSVLHLLKRLVSGGSAPPPRFWLVTRDAWAVEHTDRVSGVAQACLWGMGKVINLEHPEVRCVGVDLDPHDPIGGIDDLYAELAEIESDREDLLAYRHRERHAGRLVRLGQTAAATKDDHREIPLGGPYRLHSSEPGALSNLSWIHSARQPPGAEEVEIRVEAVGLNFIDVLDGLGMLPFVRDGIGQECAGRVTAIGARVKHLKVGDEVVAIAEGCFRSHVTTPAALVAAKPDCLSMSEAASIPANFLTAYHALYDVARIQPGERILIHAAAGGTGMAAVQLAQLAGAEVIGTASPGKWSVLHHQGVDTVLNSRTLEFAEEVMEHTGGTGVDVVVNSLAGDFIPKSLSVLRDQGRFLEIGKSGVWDEARVAREKPEVAYTLIDLREMFLREPDRAGRMLRNVLDRFVSGELKPLPLRTYSPENVVGAFRTMQQARHIGKLIVRMQAEPAAQPVTCRSDGSYLVVGGLGGLGLPVAHWLHEQGAGHIVLMGRSDAGKNAEAPLQELQDAGARVTTIRADVSDAGQVAAALDQIRSTLPPLRGIIQSAGILDDGILLHQTWERFARVMGPKVQGTWHLHCLTRHDPLDFFVLFSSVASLLGSKGQANHSAANAFLDSLAAFRRARGFPALSINWGTWSGIGAAARREQAANWQVKGVGWMPPEEGIQALAGTFDHPRAQIGIFSVTDWAAYLSGRTPSKFFDVMQAPSSTASREDRQDVLSSLAAVPADERRALLEQYLSDLVHTVLGFDASLGVNRRKGFFDLGMDSLTSVELRNRLQAAFHCTLSPTLSFDHPTIEALADYLMDDVLAATDLESPGSEPPLLTEPIPATEAELDDLSDNELADLLDRELSDPNPDAPPS